MHKVLTEEIEGKQGILELEDGWEYYGDAIWDEKKHGPLPKIEPDKLGGYIKSGDSLIFEPSKLQKHEDIKNVRAADESVRVAEKEKLIDVDKVKDLDEVKDLLKTLIKYLGVK